MKSKLGEPAALSIQGASGEGMTLKLAEKGHIEIDLRLAIPILTLAHKKIGQVSLFPHSI